MKKIVLILALTFLGVTLTSPQAAFAYNFGDYRSETLVTKAWAALAEDDLDAVLAYTNKAMEMFNKQAEKMQASLDGYVEGEKDDIFSYWALNDLATASFIQGEAYRKANMMEEARAAYQKVVDEYTYGQTWDVKGWFWKPAEAAKEKLAMLDSGVEANFGDYSSSHLVGQAWQALNSDDVEAALMYVDKTLELYKDKAKEMQESLNEYPWASNEEVFSYWALNDVGTALYIKGEALKKEGKTEEAKEVYKMLIDEFYYAQCWDVQGWFWKPAEAAQQSLDELVG